MSSEYFHLPYRRICIMCVLKNIGGSMVHKQNVKRKSARNKLIIGLFERQMLKQMKTSNNIDTTTFFLHFLAIASYFVAVHWMRCICDDQGNIKYLRATINTFIYLWREKKWQNIDASEIHSKNVSIWYQSGFFSYFVEKRDKNPTLNIRINMFYSSKHFLLPHDEDQQNINWEMEANVLQ